MYDICYLVMDRSEAAQAPVTTTPKKDFLISITISFEYLLTKDNSLLHEKILD